MTSKRTLLGAAAFSLALAGGGLAGAVLGTPGVSGAQDDTADSSADASTEATARPMGGPMGGPRGGHGGPGGPGARLETAAEALGMTADELKAELEAGASIAQVAEERGVDVQTVVDALVAAGTDRLEAAIEALPERVGELVEREGLPHRHGGRGGRPGGPPAAADSDESSADDAGAS